MARESKEERAARRKAEEEAELAELIAAYPTRLMRALEVAQTTNYEIDVVSGEMSFHVTDMENREYGKHVISLHATTFREFSDIDDLERSIQWKLDKREEERIQAEKRQAAFNKLTPEERKLLGL